MKLTIGEYEFQDNSIQFSTSVKSQYGKTGRRMQKHHRWKVWGYLKAVDAAALTTALGELESGVTDGEDVVFYDNNNNPTAHVLSSSGALNGVRVTGGVDYMAGFPGAWGAMTEYANRRSFQFFLEAEYPALEGNGLIYFRESVRLLSPGIPDFVIQEALVGDPQRQDTCETTKQIAQQAGYAIGYGDHPSFPGPVFSAEHMKPNPYRKESLSPLIRGVNGDTNFPIEWLFHFEAVSGLGATSPLDPGFD